MDGERIAGRPASVCGAGSDPAQVFISYARADAFTANQVDQLLTHWGLRAWMDRRQLGGGQDWVAGLEHAIDASQALTLILTPAALASEMVRREYLRALSRGIPVILIQARAIGALPAELAGAPLVNFHDRLRVGASLYFALADCALMPPPPDNQLEMVTPYATFTMLAGRTPPDWNVHTVPVWVYWLRALVAPLPLLFVMPAQRALTLFLPDATPGEVALGNVAFAMYVLLASIFFFHFALRATLVLLRRVAPESVILEPGACTVFTLRFDRLRLGALPRRYLYRWAASARASKTFWGETCVIFTDAANGREVVARLPSGALDSAAIAQRIVDDVAASQRRLAAPIPGAMPAAAPSPLVSVPMPSATPSYYTILAPRAYAGVVASVQEWLGARGILLVASVWDAESDGMLLPTAAGASASRFALFTDVPAVTQSPRCQAILTDLRGRGALLIPLRVTAQPPAQSPWSTTQWVDFSPAVARERSLLNLCDALDRARIPLSPWPGVFDGPVALARGAFHRLPPGWSAFTPDSGVQRQMRRWRIMRAFNAGVWTAVLGGALLIIMVAFVSALALPGLSSLQLALAVCATTLVAGAATFPLWGRVPRMVRQTWQGVDDARDLRLPECLVITPVGIAYHFLNPSFQRAVRRSYSPYSLLASFAPETEYLSGAYGFSQLARVESRRGLFGAPLLRLVTTDGRIEDLSLALFISNADSARERAVAAFATFATYNAREGS